MGCFLFSSSVTSSVKVWKVIFLPRELFSSKQAMPQAAQEVFINDIFIYVLQASRGCSNS